MSRLDGVGDGDAIMKAGECDSWNGRVLVVPKRWRMGDLKGVQPERLEQCQSGEYTLSNQYNTIQDSTVQYSTVQYSTIQMSMCGSGSKGAYMGSGG